jgi:hypothetical protein
VIRILVSYEDSSQAEFIQRLQDSDLILSRLNASYNTDFNAPGLFRSRFLLRKYRLFYAITNHGKAFSGH